MAKQKAAPKEEAPPAVLVRRSQADGIHKPILVQFKRLKGKDEEPVAAEPIRQYDHDAGLDLVVSRHISVAPSAKGLLPTNIALDLPSSVFGLVVPRSSTMYRKGLLVLTGVLDPGYRGEVQMLVWNPTGKTINVAEGDRVAQLLILPRLEVTISEVQELTAGDRGQEGFGSTGGLDQVGVSTEASER